MLRIRESLPIGVFVLLFIGLCSCACPCESSSGSSSPVGTNNPSPSDRNTAIKQNASLVEIQVEGVELTGAEEYVLHGKLLTVERINELETLAEEGQAVSLSPAYVRSADGSVDAGLEKNRELKSVRSAEKGQVIRGRITVDSAGVWRLTAVYLY